MALRHTASLCIFSRDYKTIVEAIVALDSLRSILGWGVCPEVSSDGLSVDAKLSGDLAVT